MLRVLVDTSVWIDYFRGSGDATALDVLIEDNLVCTNDLILAELVPYLRLQKQGRVIQLLETVERIPLAIDWQEIIEMQVKCLRSGANGIGIPDLIIAWNARACGCTLYSLDKHFRMMKRLFRLDLL
jgi:predicted nucleic acid-binding protein